MFRYPLDFSWMVRRAMECVQPSMIVLVELEVWPNLMTLARRRDVPVVVVNGRLTERSFNRLRRFSFAGQRAFRDLRWVGAQDETIAARFAGLGVAAEIAAKRMYTRLERLSHLRDALRQGLGSIEGMHFYGARTGRLPHNLHCCAEGVPGESLALGLDQAGLSVGLGSACNSKAMRPSSVLKAMGLSDALAQGAFVLSLGEPTTEQEIDRALKIIPDVIGKLRRVLEPTERK